MKDLLPGPENQLSISDGHGQGWPEERRLQMRMAVAVVPGLFVAIVAARRDQFVQDGRHVGAQAWLEFNGADRGSASHVEYVHDPGPDAGMGDSRGDLIRQVMHVPMASGSNRNLVLKACFRWSWHVYLRSRVREFQDPV